MYDFWSKDIKSLLPYNKRKIQKKNKKKMTGKKKTNK